MSFMTFQAAADIIGQSAPKQDRLTLALADIDRAFAASGMKPQTHQDIMDCAARHGEQDMVAETAADHWYDQNMKAGGQ